MHTSPRKQTALLLLCGITLALGPGAILAQTIFKIETLTSNNISAIEADGPIGDDRGGIAVSNSKVFLTGDSNTGIWNRADLSSPSTVGAIRDGIVMDLHSQNVYTFANSGTPVPSSACPSPFTINQLIQLDPDTGATTATVINLSTPITISGTCGDGSAQAGVFSGFDRIVLVDSPGAGGVVYNIALPSGVVTSIGTLTASDYVSRTYAESWATWGIAEFFGGENYVAYVGGPYPATKIVRTNLNTNVTSTLADFSPQDLNDSHEFTVVPSLGRWYFHYEGGSNSIAGSRDETLGFADATFTTCDADYSVTTTAGATIVPGTTDIGNHCDDCTTDITLPFPVTFYDQVFTTANVSSNGFLQFQNSYHGCCGHCIPETSGTYSNVIAALWSDLHTNGTNGEGSTDGIFTSVSGMAPNRIFNIEWVTYYHGAGPGTTAHFEIRLYENSHRIDMIYGAISATQLGGVGIQRDTGSEYVSVSCNNGPAAGTQYTFDTCATAPVTISTVASAPVNLGQSISDTATVMGGNNPTGTVTFNIFGPNDGNCSGTPVFTSTVPLDGNTQATSAPFTPSSPGTYYFIATYNGDSNNPAVATNCGDPDEIVVVSGNEVDGRGTIGVSGGQASFDLVVQNLKKGHHSFIYSDPANHLSFNATKLSPLTIQGNHAYFTGTAKMGKMKFNFTVEAYDNRPSGDQLFISTTTGYMAGGTITSGDIEIHYDMPRR